MAATGRVAILHIGGEKTGSTSLQTTLAANRAALAERGILYSRAAGQTNHILLPLHATAGRGTEDLREVSGLSRPDTFANFLDRFPDVLRREAEHSGARVVIYSSEHLSSRLPDAATVGRVCALLRGIADEVGLLYYARPQAELALAAWSTMLKSGSPAPFDLEGMLGNRAAFDHTAVVARWEPFFADAYWFFRPYQRAQLAGGDIIADFCAATGLPPEALPKRSGQLNRTLDAGCAEFLRLTNQALGLANGTPQQGGRGELVRTLERLSDGPPLALPQASVAAIEARFGPGNDALARRFLGRERLFAARTVAEPPPGPALTVERAVAIAAELWQVARNRKPAP
jgi:hypothetical protein